VAQAEFSQTLRRVVGTPIGLPAPEWLVRLGARRVLQTDPELAIYGRYVLSRRLASEGFQFQFADLQLALADLLG
jgi:NAD dependent epimerase/dehydratase family enzyme